MNKPFKIIIFPDGNITSVYSDKLDFVKLGNIDINRATEVCFDNKEKSWKIITKPPYFAESIVLAMDFSSRKSAIAYEIDYLNSHMEAIIAANGSYIPREIKVLKCPES